MIWKKNILFLGFAIVIPFSVAGQSLFSLPDPFTPALMRTSHVRSVTLYDDPYNPDDPLMQAKHTEEIFFDTLGRVTGKYTDDYIGGQIFENYVWKDKSVPVYESIRFEYSSPASGYEISESYKVKIFEGDRLIADSTYSTSINGLKYRLSGYTTYSYDESGHCTGYIVKMDNKVTRYTLKWNSGGNVVSVHEAGGAVEYNYQFNSSGNLIYNSVSDSSTSKKLIERVYNWSADGVRLLGFGEVSEGIRETGLYIYKNRLPEKSTASWDESLYTTYYRFEFY